MLDLQQGMMEFQGSLEAPRQGRGFAPKLPLTRFVFNLNQIEDKSLLKSNLREDG